MNTRDCCSGAKSGPTLWPWTAAHQASLSFNHLPELAQTHVHQVSDATQLLLSSVTPFSSCFQSFPESGSFPMSQFFTSGGQSIGVSASALVLPRNTQEWFPLGWTGWIFLQSRPSPNPEEVSASWDYHRARPLPPPFNHQFNSDWKPT